MAQVNSEQLRSDCLSVGQTIGWIGWFLSQLFICIFVTLIRLPTSDQIGFTIGTIVILFAYAMSIFLIGEYTFEKTPNPTNRLYRKRVHRLTLFYLVVSFVFHGVGKLYLDAKYQVISELNVVTWFNGFWIMAIVATVVGIFLWLFKRWCIVPAKVSDNNDVEKGKYIDTISSLSTDSDFSSSDD